MLLGALLLILQARHPDPHALPLRVALVMGLVAGLGAWIEPLMAEYLLPLGLYAWPLLTPPRSLHARMSPARPLTALALGAVVGGAPLLAYNLQHRWATLSYLVAQSGQRVDHLASVTRLMTESLPVLLGLAVPNSNHGAFVSLSARYPVQRAVGIVAGLYLLGRLVPALPRRIAALLTDQPVADESSSRQTPRARKLRDGALALFAASGLLFFLGTHFGVGDSAIDTARYLLPLYTATPLVASPWTAWTYVICRSGSGAGQPRGVDAAGWPLRRVVSPPVSVVPIRTHTAYPTSEMYRPAGAPHDCERGLALKDHGRDGP